MDEPVLVRPLPKAFSPFSIVIKSVGLFYESEVNEDVDVADDGTSREPSGVSYGLVSGEALVGTTVAVGEDDIKRPPSRGSDQGKVAFGQLLKNDQRILFFLAGLGLGRGSITTS